LCVRACVRACVRVLGEKGRSAPLPICGADGRAGPGREAADKGVEVAVTELVREDRGKGPVVGLEHFPVRRLPRRQPTPVAVEPNTRTAGRAGGESTPGAASASPPFAATARG
jgi:hypothetical protein